LHCYSYVLAAVIQNSPDGDKCDDKYESNL